MVNIQKMAYNVVGETVEKSTISYILVEWYNPQGEEIVNTYKKLSVHLTFD